MTTLASVVRVLTGILGFLAILLVCWWTQDTLARVQQGSAFDVVALVRVYLEGAFWIAAIMGLSLALYVATSPAFRPPSQDDA